MTLEAGFTSLFDGSTLTGWRAIPRSYGQLYPGGPDVLDVLTDFPRDYQERADASPAAWSVEDGEIVGRQRPAGSGRCRWRNVRIREFADEESHDHG